MRNKSGNKPFCRFCTVKLTQRHNLTVSFLAVVSACNLSQEFPMEHPGWPPPQSHRGFGGLGADLIPVSPYGKVPRGIAKCRCQVIHQCSCQGGCPRAFNKDRWERRWSSKHPLEYQTHLAIPETSTAEALRQLRLHNFQGTSFQELLRISRQPQQSMEPSAKRFQGRGPMRPHRLCSQEAGSALRVQFSASELNFDYWHP